MTERSVSGLAKLLFRRSFRRAARATITGRDRSARHPERGRFTDADVDRLLRGMWARYDALSPDLPAEPGLGPKLMVRVACATLAAHDQLVHDGVDRDHAIELVGDAAWVVYRRWGRIAQLIARVRGGDADTRFRAAIDLFLRFPVTRPAYRYDRYSPSPSVIALDIRRCPVADYFAGRGARDVCVGTWCRQDFALTEMWGGSLRRTGTIAGGCDHCDFRYTPPRAARPAGAREARR